MPGFDSLDALRDALDYAPTWSRTLDGPAAAELFHSSALLWLRDDVGLEVEASGDRPLRLLALGDDAGQWMSVYAVPVDELREDQAAALEALGTGATFRLELDGLTPAERAGALWLLVGAGYHDAAHEAARLGAGTGIDLEALRASIGAFEPHAVSRRLDGRVVALTVACLST